MIIAILYLFTGYIYAHCNRVAIELTVLMFKQEEEAFKDAPDDLLIMLVSGLVMLLWPILLIDELINKY